MKNINAEKFFFTIVMCKKGYTMNHIDTKKSMIEANNLGI